MKTDPEKSEPLDNDNAGTGMGTGEAGKPGDVTPALKKSRAKGKPGSRRGFAGWTPEKQAEVARKGGIAAHANGKGHEFSAAEAREAGRKGGLAAQAAKKAAAARKAAGGE